MIFLLSFYCLSIQVQNSDPSLFQVNFFYIRFIHLSRNIISIIDMPNEYKYCYWVCYTYKNIANDNKNLNFHFTSAALILASLAQFRKSWSVLQQLLNACFSNIITSNNKRLVRSMCFVALYSKWDLNVFFGWPHTSDMVMASYFWNSQ